MQFCLTRGRYEKEALHILLYVSKDSLPLLREEAMTIFEDLEELAREWSGKGPDGWLFGVDASNRLHDLIEKWRVKPYWIPPTQTAQKPPEDFATRISGTGEKSHDTR